MGTGHVWILTLVCGVVCLAAETPKLQATTPLTPPAQTFPVPGAWRRFQPGDPGYAFGRDFYFAEQGNYIRLKPGNEAPFVQTGLWGHLIPGHWQLNHFDPATYAKAAPVYQRLVDAWRENAWPLHTIQYHVMYGNPLPTKEAIAAAGNLWIGDNMPEAPIYRLDFLFEFLHTGKWRRKGSSVRPAMHEPMTRFLENDLLPRLKEALPFCQDPAHVWTHRELRTLKDIYCAEFFREIGKPVAWGMYVSPHFLANLPQTTCVAEKGADAFSNARAKGIMRQAGGGKFYFTWRGHEPTERYGYFRRGWYATPARQEWGYPLPHLWYYLFRPYFIGANYSIVEAMPGSLVQDLEEDGQYELSTLGHISTALFDYVERVPERGTAYSAVALLRNYDRPNTHGLSRWHIVEPDDAAYMNHGLLHEVIFPQHRHTRHSGGYSITAPYGEIFDILAPNMPGKPVSPALFEGYKVLFALGGQRIEKHYASVLMDYVRNGGTLIINVEDLGAWLPPAFFGIKSLGEDIEGRSVTSESDGAKSAENAFRFPAIKLGEANALYTCEGRPVVTKCRVGKGYAILVGARHMVQSAEVEVEMGRHGARRLMKPLLNFVPSFIERMTTGVTPFDIQIAAEDRPDISWLITRQGDGWRVILFNYSLKREELVARSMGTAKVIAEYPYKPVPFKIVCRAPMRDVVELFEERDVNWQRQENRMVVSESMRGGDIRVYDFRPRRIELAPRERFVNYARNAAVTASSTLRGFSTQPAVDGKRDNDDYWQSDLDAKRRYVFDMPQWLRMDFGAPKLIDHVFVQFSVWPHRSLFTRQHIYRYTVEASLDGEQWRIVLDESKNEDPAREEGLERWFEATTARYVRLTVLRNSARGGAKVVELKVMGPERETARPQRKSIVPKWQVQFPPEVAEAPAKNVRYLVGMKPKHVEPGWLPPGKTWEQMNGWIRLYTDFSQQGAVFTRSIYGESVCRILYDVPEDARTFAAAVGLGNRHRQASVVFKVLVDGKPAYDSGLYRLGCRVLPVVVDVVGARELTLIVEDGGDGINYDYAWWGDARFLK